MITFLLGVATGAWAMLVIVWYETRATRRGRSAAKHEVPFGFDDWYREKHGTEPPPPR